MLEDTVEVLTKETVSDEDDFLVQINQTYSGWLLTHILLSLQPYYYMYLVVEFYLIDLIE